MGNESFDLQFLGACGTVTGSKYLIRFAGRQILVDCGLFQGLKQLRLRNWAPLPVEPAGIDAVILSHAHLDHSGYLPRLVEAGFRGPVFCTTGTRDLLGLLLPDSGHLQEEEARFANRHGFSKHHPALPLYTKESAVRSLQLIRTCAFDRSFEPIAGIEARFSHAGHIIGAASVHLKAGSRSILFSGDLGRNDDIVMMPPAAPPAANVVLLESTYGDRRHPEEPPLDGLAAVISGVASRGGNILIPAFAVGRAQTLLHLILTLKQMGRIPDLPLFLNSPMAASGTVILKAHNSEHRLDSAQRRALAEGVRIVKDEEQSRSLNSIHYPSIIVAASGMATGGRVVHHLKAFAPDPRNAVVLVGHQAVGTRGAALAAGAREIRIHGSWIPVRAEVVALDGLSAHADRGDLLDWLGAIPRPPEHVYVTHGEPAAADSLRQAIEETHRMAASVPEYLQTVTI